MYKCQYPNCTYETTNRDKIENHHIIPKSKNGSNQRWNRIFLCPTHHKYIYIPGEVDGQHKPGKDKIELLGWLSSTGNRVLQYKDTNGVLQFIEEKI